MPVKTTTGGGISVCCQWCDLSAYAKNGTEAKRRIMAKLPAKEPEPPKPAPAANPPASPTLATA